MIPLLRAAAATAIGCASFMVFAYAPPFFAPNPTTGATEYLGEQFRIFLFHVPAAWVAFLLYLLSAGASAAYLARRRPAADRLARAAAEVGLLLGTVNIVTGPIWAKPTWGVWWTWEPRLTTALVLWLVWLGYVVLRAQIPEAEKGARLGAAIALLGALWIPVVHFAVQLWGRVAHPAPGPGFISDPRIRLALRLDVLAFAVVAAYLVARRVEVLRLEAERGP